MRLQMFQDAGVHLRAEMALVRSVLERKDGELLTWGIPQTCSLEAGERGFQLQSPTAVERIETWINAAASLTASPDTCEVCGGAMRDWGPEPQATLPQR